MRPLHTAYLNAIRDWEQMKQVEFIDPTPREAMLILTIDTLLDLLERALGL